MQSAAPTADPDAGCACSPRGIGRASTGSPLQVASKSQLRSRLQYAQRLWPPERLWRKQQAGCRGARPLKESHTTEGHQVSTTPREQLTPSQECCAHLHQKPPGGGSTSALSTIALCRETPPASRRRSDDVIAGEDRRTQEWLWSGCAGRRGGGGKPKQLHGGAACSSVPTNPVPHSACPTVALRVGGADGTYGRHTQTQHPREKTTQTSPPNENCEQQTRAKGGSPEELSTDGVYPGRYGHRNNGNSWGHNEGDGSTTRNPQHGDAPTYQATGVREHTVAHKTSQTLQPAKASAIGRHTERSTKRRKPEEACITHPN